MKILVTGCYGFTPSDRRYSLSSEKLRGYPVHWKPEYDLERTITETVQQYHDHLSWLV